MANFQDVKHQYYAGMCANIISMSYGAFCGWLSASILELQSASSPLATGPMNNVEAGWVGAIFCLGGLIGTIVFTFISERIGRKRCLLLVALPAFLGWVLIALARSPLHLCIARILGGAAGGGAFSVIPIYTTELAVDNVRGTLGSFLVLSCNIGMLMAFVLGYYLSYVTVAYVLSTLSLLFFVCFSFLPETPAHLLKHNKITEAETALRYYRNLSASDAKALSEELEMELRHLKCLDDVAPKDAMDKARLNLSDFTNPIARKSILIAIALIALNQFCGCFAMLNYTASIFEQSGTNLPSTVAAMIVGVIQLVGCYLSTTFVERAGRKALLTISAAGAALGLACLGCYSHLRALGYDVSHLGWLPIASFSFTICIGCFGVLTLPFLVISEITPPKIRSIVNMFSLSLLWIFAFYLIRYLPEMVTLLGMHGTMYIFSACSMTGAAFVLCCVPETKGKSIEAILASL